MGFSLILTAALPYAQALMKLIQLATRHEESPLTEMQIQLEINRIREWASAGEAADLQLFKDAKAKKAKKG